MQDFAEALARFARGELKHGDLFDLAEQQNATGRLDPAQTASTLDTLLRQGQLSTADYLSIKDYIGHITRQRGGDDDRRGHRREWATPIRPHRHPPSHRVVCLL